MDAVKDNVEKETAAVKKRRKAINGALASIKAGPVRDSLLQDLAKLNKRAEGNKAEEKEVKKPRRERERNAAKYMEMEILKRKIKKGDE